MLRRQASEVLPWAVGLSAFSCEAKPLCAAHIPHDDVLRSYLPLNLLYITEIFMLFAPVVLPSNFVLDNPMS